ncbi:hypothetical protein LR48_Vigan09g028400 [Vigna angularis]|uniref:Uncharacterized protein n=1 Tax=Phaseolus angularis TaxID=3914 RepID=A0A0L9V953_PHAAN|nr:hypothetical protein LR48_Vigan09g028400 [Vigna angularis]
MARRLRLFKEQMAKAGVSPSTWPAVKLEELERDLQINANNEKLKHAYNEPSEYKLVQKKQKINAVAHQKKLEFQITAERSIDSPLLLEQVSGRLAELKTPCRIASPEHSIADNWISL